MAFTKICSGVVPSLLLAACTAQPDSDDTMGSATTGGPTSTTELTATTIPLPGESSSGGGVTGDDSTGGESSSSTGGGSTDSTGPADSGSTTDPSESSSSSGGMAVYDVEWCRLQYPPDVSVAIDEVFTVYVRFFVPDLTTLSTGNDPAPELWVEMGYGVDGSDPSMGMGAPWTYVPAMPNVGWDDAVEPNNDEYQADLMIDTAGIYDYAARISGDGGRSWVYCDLDDLLTGGYTPDQAGHAEVGQ